MALASIAASGFRHVLDFALPPRCGGCSDVVATLDTFCAGCWAKLQFLGERGCSTCGIPLEATDAASCAACLARPPRIRRTRAAVAYDEIPRSLALRLKYGRKVALARTMARYMAPLVESDAAALLVPVPLHRNRLWQRGFNQAVLIARALSKRTGMMVCSDILARTRNTPPLKGLSLTQRRRAVASAFAVRNPAAIKGRRIVLVDDVLTTGSTANACARALRRAGAQSVDLVAWARVVRPVKFD